MAKSRMDLIYHINLDVIDKGAVIDNFYQRPPGWAISTFDEKQLTSITRALLSKLVVATRVDQGDDAFGYTFDPKAFCYAIAMARLHTQGLNGEAYTKVPDDDGEYRRTLIEVEADAVDAEYEHHFSMAIAHEVGA